MPLVPADYKASVMLYAIDWSTLRPERDWILVDYVATITKDGIPQVTKGELHWLPHKDSGTKRDDLIAEVDTHDSYAIARWDGDYMWAPKTTLAKMVELSEELDPILKELPIVPVGYEGWFRLVA